LTASIEGVSPPNIIPSVLEEPAPPPYDLAVLILVVSVQLVPFQDSVVAITVPVDPPAVKADVNFQNQDQLCL
jgi:hypothetical protein